MRKSVSTLVALGLAMASPVLATTYWVPNPLREDTSKPATKLEMSKGGTRRLNVTFIPTGVDGTGRTGTSAVVDNRNEKPDVFNVAPFITGVGMLKLVNEPGPTVGSGTLFLNKGETLVWSMPIITSANWFQASSTAFMQNLARTANGHSNVEIMNFGTATATCQLQLKRPAGTLLGAARSIPLLPLSHLVVEDPLLGALATPTGAGLRAEVSCNQPFYAYATFVDPDMAKFRMLYPLNAPPAPVVETVSLDRNGTFFSPAAGRSEMGIDIPLVVGRHYRAATIDFDVNIHEFTPLFTGLVGMFHTGGARFNKTLYFGTFVRGFRSRTLVDLGSAVVEPAMQANTNWQQGATHHVMIVYDTQAATMRMQVTRGGTVVLDRVISAYNLELVDTGGKPVKLNFGLGGVADGAYFPPLGWKFSNLKVRVTR